MKRQYELVYNTLFLDAPKPLYYKGFINNDY